VLASIKQLQVAYYLLVTICCALLVIFCFTVVIQTSVHELLQTVQQYFDPRVSQSLRRLFEFAPAISVRDNSHVS
jgi:hypothetical protein